MGLALKQKREASMKKQKLSKRTKIGIWFLCIVLVLLVAFFSLAYWNGQDEQQYRQTQFSSHAWVELKIFECYAEPVPPQVVDLPQLWTPISTWVKGSHLATSNAGSGYCISLSPVVSTASLKEGDFNTFSVQWNTEGDITSNQQSREKAVASVLVDSKDATPANSEEGFGPPPPPTYWNGAVSNIIHIGQNLGEAVAPAGFYAQLCQQYGWMNGCTQ
jgi:hypothetical protein